MIFVFGSNLAGRHGLGAALTAAHEHGAEYGVGEGRTGSAYAIPTKDEKLRVRTLPEINASVQKFIKYAKANPRLTFKVTRIGCGHAKYSDDDIAPMFSTAPSNCVLPDQWLDDDPVVNLIGIDASLTSTGLAYYKGDYISAYCIGDPSLLGIPRLKFIRDAVENALCRFRPDVVVLEGYALGFRGKSNTIFGIGELGGVLQLLILERGIDILLVPPTSLKLFITGKGNADKKSMMKCVGEITGSVFTTSDQYDAAGLLLMGEAKFNFSDRKTPLSAHCKKALDGCKMLSRF